MGSVSFKTSVQILIFEQAVINKCMQGNLPLPTTSKPGCWREVVLVKALNI